jgi:hypothetical protein
MTKVDCLWFTLPAAREGAAAIPNPHPQATLFDPNLPPDVDDWNQASSG